MRLTKIKNLLLLCVILLGLIPLKIHADNQFPTIRVLLPASNPAPGTDPRVAISGAAISDPETANIEDYFHWQSDAQGYSTVNFYYSIDFPTYITNLPGLIQCFTDSAATWTNVPTAKLNVNIVSGKDYGWYDNPTLYDAPWIYDNDNVISFSYDAEIEGFNDSYHIGITFITWDSGDIDGDGDTNELLDCDIILNASEFDEGGHFIWTVGSMDYDNNELDIQSVVTHEMGHTFGIAHPTTQPVSVSGDCPTMYAYIEPAFDDNLEMRTLEEYDIMCVSFLYPNLDDGNDLWEDADMITASEEGVEYNDLSIIPGDYDWYKIELDQYDTVKIRVGVFNSNILQHNIKLYLTLTPSIFNPSNSNDTHNVEIYGYEVTDPVINDKLEWKSGHRMDQYQLVYAHTVMIPGVYYILAKGYYDTSETEYMITAYKSNDGDGIETDDNAEEEIPAGDGLPDYWEIANGLDPTNINDIYEDLDNDGLSTIMELDNTSTDHLNPDTDNDGMTDGWEYYNALNPLTDDSSLDADNDGMTNLEEFIAGTDPQDSESVIAVKDIYIYAVETGFGYTSGMQISWENMMEFSFKIYYSSSPDGPFQLMTEFEPGNEFETGLNGDCFTDLGYPEPPDPEAGSIRSNPLSSEVEARYYRIHKKTD